MLRASGDAIISAMESCSQSRWRLTTHHLERYQALTLIVLLLACCFALLSACRQQAADTAAPQTSAALPAMPAVAATDPAFSILRRGNGSEPATLDPHLSVGVPASNIIRDLFEGLTSESPGGEIVPGAASHWNISRDGKTYTFYLRDNVLWSNGDPLLAEDFVYGLQRSLDPATGSQYGQILAPISNATAALAGTVAVSEIGVQALNERTVQIELENPTPYFLTLLSHPATFPAHRASIERWGNEHVRPGRLVCNGAYVLAEWVAQAGIKLIRNPRYWDAASTRIDQVNYYPISDTHAELNRFRAGELDWTYEVPNSQFDWLRENMREQLIISPWMGTYYLGMNLTREPLGSSGELRMALNLAIDRDILTSKVTRFGELPSFNLVPPGVPDYQQAELDYMQWSQAQRERRAVELYRQAGYSRQRPLELQLRYNNSANNNKIALAVAAMWKQLLGVHTSLINEEWKVFLQNRRQKRVTQVFRSGWIGDYGDAYTFLDIFRGDHGQNDTGFDNPSYNLLLQQIAAERLASRRARLMREAERLLLAEQPIIPLYTYVTKRLVNPDLGGWQSNVMDHHYSKSMYFKQEPVTPAASPPAAEQPPVAPEPGTDEQEPGAEAGNDTGGAATTPGISQ